MTDWKLGKGRSMGEECGVFGIYAGPGGCCTDLAHTAYFGLFALQHRGQESCGIVVNDDGLFRSYKDVGIVGDVFTPRVLQELGQGNIAVGHVRYGTTGANNRNNCQPIQVNHQKGKLALAHNGNLSNAFQLRSELELNGAIFHSTSDTEIIAYIVTQERLKTPSIEDALCQAMYRLEAPSPWCSCPPPSCWRHGTLTASAPCAMGRRRMAPMWWRPRAAPCPLPVPI